MNKSGLRRLILSFLLVVMALSSLSALARAEVCSEIQDKKLELPSKWSAFWTLFQIKFLAGMLALPDAHMLPTKSLQVRKTSNEIKYRHIIFSVGPLPDIDRSITDTEESAFYALEYNLSLQRRKLYELIQADSYESCKLLQKQNGFDDVTYLDFLRQEQDLYNIRNKLAQRLVDKAWKYTNLQLALDWELIRYTDIGEVKKILERGDVADVIFLTHGTDMGTLIDSRIREFPQDFFSHLPPAIRSISIFSCYSNEIAKFYSIESSLQNSDSYHRRRFLIQVKKSGALGDGAPADGFGSFLKSVDSLLGEESQRAYSGESGSKETSSESKSEKLCRLHIKSNLRGKDYGVILNQAYLGLLTSSDNTFEYPCSYLLNPRNVLILRSLSLRPQFTDFESQIETSLENSLGQLIPSSSSQLFWNTDKSFKRAKFLFF